MRKDCDSCLHDRFIEGYCDDCHYGLEEKSPTKWEPAPHYTPDTNADRIRAMSDEELAKFLRWDVCSKIGNGNRMCNGWCDKCVIEWLKQPAEE